MTTMALAPQISPGRIARTERHLIDTVLTHNRRRTGLRVPSKSETRREIIEVIAPYERMLRARQYRELYDHLSDGCVNLTSGYVKVEYAIRLFSATLVSEPDMALLAYDLVGKLASSARYVVPCDVDRRGISLCRKFVLAVARCMR